VTRGLCASLAFSTVGGGIGQGQISFFAAYAKIAPAATSFLPYFQESVSTATVMTIDPDAMMNREGSGFF
jgi:hypothetical protein